MKILIVDDSPAMQTIVRRGIEQLGYNQLTLKKASNGKEALDIIRVWEPELVISDWYMPEMTGMDLLTALNREMLGIPIGFVTPEDSENRVQEALNAGAQFVVQTPFDTKTLHKAVLPIIQGSIDGENTLQEHITDKHNPNKTTCTYDHIVLPTITTVKQSLINTALNIESTQAIQLKEQHFPYLLGLYGDKNKKSVLAVAILDLKGICAMGSLSKEVGTQDIDLALSEKVIPKPVMDHCQAILSSFENILHHAGKNENLTLRSTNLMRKHNANVDKLLEKNANDRLDISLSINAIKHGKLSFIVS